MSKESDIQLGDTEHSWSMSDPKLHHLPSRTEGHKSHHWTA